MTEMCTVGGHMEMLAGGRSELQLKTGSKAVKPSSSEAQPPGLESHAEKDSVPPG